jgi:putative flippase GtrA
MAMGTSRDDLAPVVGIPVAARLYRGVSRPRNWLQLVRFAAVGGIGYVVNLSVFAACVHVFGIDYRISAVIAFLVAVCNNFWLNRHWTFVARNGHLGVQAVRFFAVSLVTFGFTYVVLIVLVDGAGLREVPAQAIAIALGTPCSFVGQKLWSFKA